MRKDFARFISAITMKLLTIMLSVKHRITTQTIFLTIFVYLICPCSTQLPNIVFSGRINMYDSYHGSRLAGLTEYEYMFVLTNYEDLRMEAENQS